MSNAYRNATNIERRLDMEDYERFKDFLPNKSLEHDTDRITRARRVRAERKLWTAQRELIARAWG